jgi:AcrR family transcriptional regulator
VTRKLRTDAEQNRVRILAGARAAFASDGLDLPMRDLARRLDLGVATIYRHFPSRRDLIAAVLVEEVARCGEEMRGDLADPDPCRALRGAIVRFGRRQVDDRGLNEALLGSHAAGIPFVEQRREHAEAFASLVERARAEGGLRDGVSVEAARVALMAIASFRVPPTERAAAVVATLTAVLIAGLMNEAQ